MDASVRRRGERGAEGGEGAVARKDVHHQVTPGGEVHVHLSCSQEVFTYRTVKEERG